MTEKLLVLEDERNVGSTLVERLKKDGFEVTWSTTIHDALEAIAATRYDLAILDVGLPDGSGFDVARAIRKSRTSTAVLFLTAMGNPEDRVKGLELGAEDYVVKPFHLQELLLRIRNALKRARSLSNEATRALDGAQIGRAKVYFSRFEAETASGVQPLTHKECALLRLLAERRGQVVSRDQILNEVWSEDEYPTPRTVDNFILRLRKLVELDADRPQVIKSVRGVGYQLV